jgi:hypothetical protein
MGVPSVNPSCDYDLAALLSSTNLRTRARKKAHDPKPAALDLERGVIVHPKLHAV